jgi:cytochrome bd-type quinol oxidase subunit 2
VAHCILFWGGDIKTAFKSARKGSYDDRHHTHMAKHYKEAPWWWYMAVLVFSFILGLIVVTKENVTLPVWAYIVSLLLGIFIAPFVSMPAYNYCPKTDISNATSEYLDIFSLRQWYCHEQLVQNAGRSHDSWTPHW